MIPFFHSKRAASALGLSLDGNRLEGVVVRRTNGHVQIRQHFAANLALSPLTGDPELAGREIRNHLDKAGIREKRVAFCVPLNCVLSLQTSVPDMPEAERADFLQLEAERGFHSDDLIVANSIFKNAKGGAFATLLSVSRGNVGALEAALGAAKLKPATFGLGIAAMQPAAQDPGRRIFTLVVGANSIGLQVTAGGGIVALRSLDGAIEMEGAQRRLSAELVARELRITQGQLPGELGTAGSVLRIFGQTEMAKQLAADLTSRLPALGLTLEMAQRASNANFDGAVPPEIALSPALALAADWARGATSNPEFLPPKIQAWQQFAAKGLTPRLMIRAGATVGFAVFCVIAAFGWQQWKIHSLQRQLDAISTPVAAIDHAQDQIRTFRSWYDNQFRALQGLRKLTQAFSDDGAVAAKTVEIRNLASVTCSGTARDNQAFLAMHDKLGRLEGVSGLHAEVPRAQKPLQFTINFQLDGAVTNGN